MEVWKDIPGYEGLYQVSDLGYVKSYHKHGNTNTRILKNSLDKGGYYYVGLCENGKRKFIKNHQLVAIAFLNHKPNGHTLVCNHINFNRQDNRVENIEIITSRENTNRKHLKSTSIYTGVCRVRRVGDYDKWKAAITVGSKQLRIGLFTSELKAYEAYKSALDLINNGKSIQPLIDQYKCKYGNKYTGVYSSGNNQKWRARIKINGKLKHLGSFINEYDAHLAYQKALNAKLSNMQNPSVIL